MHARHVVGAGGGGSRVQEMWGDDEYMSMFLPSKQEKTGQMHLRRCDHLLWCHVATQGPTMTHFASLAVVGSALRQGWATAPA